MLTLLITLTAAAAPEMIPNTPLDLVGRTAPDFEAVTTEGVAFKLAETRGQRVILAFWASWCGPCRLELPALAEFQKTRNDVVIYAVNVDRQQRDADKFLQSVEFDLPIVWDNKAMALGQYDVTSMPTMFLLDPQGTVKWRKTGFSQETGLSKLETQLATMK